MRGRAPAGTTSSAPPGAASAYTATAPVRPAPRVAAAHDEPAQEYDEPLQLGAPPSAEPIY